MSFSPEDQERLPPMIPHAEVNERARLDGLKDFRKYMVDTGVVKCLAKLYQHTAQTEMRLDNPLVVQQFMAKYDNDDPNAQESLLLSRENETLREYNEVLARQAEELALEVEKQLRTNTALRVWSHLVSAEFWEGASDKLTLDQVYRRLCGQKADKLTQKVLVDLIRPIEFPTTVEGNVTQQGFVDWVVEGSSFVMDFLRSDLSERFRGCPASQAPFEADLLKEIYESGMHPDHLRQLADVVRLSPGLRAFLIDMASHFGR